MKTNLKDNIWIEGFERKSLMYDRILQLGGEQNILYKGKTTEIPEELAKVCAEKNNSLGYKDYTKKLQFKEIPIKSLIIDYSIPLKESIQSACPFEDCIIYRLG